MRDARRSIVPVLGLLLLLGSCQRNEPPPAKAKAPAPQSAAFCKPRAGAFPPPARLEQWADGAQLLPGLGVFHRAVTTKSEEAQKYFDQGMRLVWGFNHDEATRAFVKAAQLDPECASCWWGASLTLGPNYNFPLMPDRAQAAWEALGKAQALSGKASPVEQALIAALAQRSKGPEALDPVAMQPFLEAYARAMGEVAKQFPDDDDVQVLHAEALMTTSAWKLWTPEGQPAPVTPQIVAILEKSLARDANHPGANHYYIHTMEASPTPAKAVASAERLAGLMEGAGHIVHMPAHIFQRVGRYAEAEAANRDGAAADLAYLKKVMPQGYYTVYLAHNYDFQAFSAAMRGRSKEAVAAERKAVEAAPAYLLDNVPGMDFYTGKVVLAQVRFGLWDDVLAEKAPADKYPVWTGLHRFARAYALAAKGDLDAAAREKAELDTYIGRLPAELAAGFNGVRDVLSIGAQLVGARIAQGQGKADDAIALLKDAVAREDRLAYNEPEDWFFPTRHVLGAALLQAGKAREAEAVYREDLAQHPENGWALFGLARALEAQERDASDVQKRFEAAWKDADVTLTASAM